MNIKKNKILKKYYERFTHEISIDRAEVCVCCSDMTTNATTNPTG